MARELVRDMALGNGSTTSLTLDTFAIGLRLRMAPLISQRPSVHCALTPVYTHVQKTSSLPNMQYIPGEIGWRWGKH